MRITKATPFRFELLLETAKHILGRNRFSGALKRLPRSFTARMEADLDAQILVSQTLYGHRRIDFALHRRSLLQTPCTVLVTVLVALFSVAVVIEVAEPLVA